MRSILTEVSAGPEMVGGITAVLRAGRDHPPALQLVLGGCPWHLCSSGSGDPALPGAGSRGMVAAVCSRWPALALCPATPGTAACNSPGSDCPVCKSTARAHLGEQSEIGTARPGSHLVLRDPVGRLSLATDLTRGLQAPSRASRAVASHSRTWDTHSLLLVARSCPVALLARHLPGMGAGDMLPAQSTQLLPPPPARGPLSAIPEPVLLCSSGRYLAAGGF